ncbi:unnamed protein product [Linum trigynum]|uniref:Uncharacterized protein n=1 Tax=Linum trigynum TaxID=586398 RepID=A0AAV2F973_9ROSI
MAVCGQAILEYFTNPDMESAKEDVLDHMNELWRTWRSRMNRDHVKPHDSLVEILEDVPEFLSKEDWEWCVKEKFLSEEFLVKQSYSKLHFLLLLVQWRQRLLSNY